jgi:hypothetical protein
MSFVKDVFIKGIQGNAAWCRELIELIDHRWFPRVLRTFGPPDDTLFNNHAKVRSTTHLLAWTLNPAWSVAVRLTSTVLWSTSAAQDPNDSPERLPAQTTAIAGCSAFAHRRASPPPSGSWGSASGMHTAISPPSLATRRGRVRSPMRLAPSEPQSPLFPLSAPTGCRARRRSAPAPAWPVPGPLPSARRGGASRCRHRSGRERSYRPFIRGTGRGVGRAPATRSDSVPVPAARPPPPAAHAAAVTSPAKRALPPPRTGGALRASSSARIFVELPLGTGEGTSPLLAGPAQEGSRLDRAAGTRRRPLHADGLCSPPARRRPRASGRGAGPRLRQPPGSPDMLCRPREELMGAAAPRGPAEAAPGRHLRPADTPAGLPERRLLPGSTPAGPPRAGGGNRRSGGRARPAPRHPRACRWPRSQGHWAEVASS